MKTKPEKTEIDHKLTTDCPQEVVSLLDKWRDDAAWLERLGGRLEPYNAYTADAIRACREELKQAIQPQPAPSHE